MNAKDELGLLGESQAKEFLKQKGLKFIAQHFQTRWGEIDLIFREGESWVFVEVKTRTRRTDPSAADAVTPAKQKRLVKASLSYMKMKRLEDHEMRFDVVLIEEGKIDWLKDAFQPVVPYTF